MKPVLPDLEAQQRAQALTRWSVLRPHLEDGVPLSLVAGEAKVSLRTAERWLARYRDAGLDGLGRVARSDHGVRSLPTELVELIEGLALQRPKAKVSTITRRAAMVAESNGWSVPSYSTVYRIVAGIDPHLATLAHGGATALRDRFELVFRRQSDRPNDLWQADHTELDLLVLDANGSHARPWLSVVLDDCSRAVAGYSVFLGAPSALNLSLALRQAIWPKSDPRWAVHGLPDVLYVDHGSDFTSEHLTHVAADLKIELFYSTVARPQGRGKIERIIGSITSELLPLLPGHLVHGKATSPPRLTLPELDAAIGRWIIDDYHQRQHSETGVAPQTAWIADGWLPRLPESLEDLDLLLVMVATPRIVHRDGIRFQGLRYLDPTLAAYVGEAVTIRYDPRDIGEVRVFHRDHFLCRAISAEHAGESITLKDLQTARSAHRRALRQQLTERNSRVTEYLPTRPSPTAPCITAPSVPERPRLRTYREDIP